MITRRGRGEPEGPRSSLAVVDQAPVARERADAARNRAEILSAARRLLRRKPIDSICMDALAAAANVGKGTLYRRFPDRAALCHALLDEETRLLQERVLGGFGLPAETSQVDRLMTLVGALFDFALDHRALLSAAAAARRSAVPHLQHPAHLWRRQAIEMHLRAAVRRREIPSLDPGLTAELILGSLEPDLLAHLVEERGDEAALKDNLLAFWRGALRSGAAHGP